VCEITDPETNAEWRIQPVWPLRFPYLVLEVGKEYEYTVIRVPNRKYIWIMSRESEMDESLYASLSERPKPTGDTTWGGSKRSHRNTESSRMQKPAHSVLDIQTSHTMICIFINWFTGMKRIRIFFI
jgi:hypothetical protein